MTHSIAKKINYYYTQNLLPKDYKIKEDEQIKMAVIGTVSAVSMAMISVTLSAFFRAVLFMPIPSFDLEIAKIPASFSIMGISGRTIYSYNYALSLRMSNFFHGRNGLNGFFVTLGVNLSVLTVGLVTRVRKLSKKQVAITLIATPILSFVGFQCLCSWSTAALFRMFIVSSLTASLSCLYLSYENSTSAYRTLAKLCTGQKNSYSNTFFRWFSRFVFMVHCCFFYYVYCFTFNSQP